MTVISFAFFNYISPLMTIIFAYLKIKIRMRNDSQAEMEVVA